MKTSTHPKQKLEQIVLELAATLADKFWPQLAVSPLNRLNDGRHRIGYVDISALRECFEQQRQDMGSAYSAEDLQDVIVDGLHSSQSRVAEICSAMIEVLKAPDTYRLEAAYRTPRTYLEHGDIDALFDASDHNLFEAFQDRRCLAIEQDRLSWPILSRENLKRSLSDTECSENCFVSFHRFIYSEPYLFEGLFLHSDWELTEWKNTIKNTATLMLLSTWSGSVVAGHHLVALDCVFPLVHYDPNLLLCSVAANSGAPPAVDDDYEVDASGGDPASLARISRLFFGAPTQVEDDSLVILDMEWKNDDGDKDCQAGSEPMFRVARAFFGNKGG